MKKIPDNAKKVFEGSFFSVWQWDQVLYDGSTKVFEYVSRPDIVSIVAVTKEGKILFLEEEQPSEKKIYTFPSGTIESGETSASCALRELEEETGYTTGDLAHWFSLPIGARVDAEYHIFIARNCVKECDQKLDAGERISLEEITLEELLAKIENIPFKNMSLYHHFIKAKYSEEYKKHIQDLLGITT